MAEIFPKSKEFALLLKKKLNIYLDGKKFIANALAGDIIFDNFDCVNFTGENRGFIVTNDKNLDIYYYHDGVYVPYGEDVIRAVARQVLGDRATNTMLNEVVYAVQFFLNIRVDIDEFNNYVNLINMKNGVFNTDTGQLLPHDKKYYFTHKLDIEYVKDATCPRIRKFLTEVHKPEDIPVIQELFGYCLYPKYCYHKLFFFIGNGRNGKGTETRLMEAMLGKRNVTAVSISNLTNDPHHPAELFGKLANICGEVGNEPIENTQVLKQLTGEDIINANRKFGQPFEFTNFAKLVYCTNDPPEIKDKSNAMWDRMIYIDFPNQFLDKAQGTDPDLINKLKTKEELSGLFNWAVEGLLRLKKQGGFTYSKTVDENLKEYDRKSSPVLAFAQAHIDEVEGAFIFKEVFTTRLRDWCIKNKVRQVPANQITKKLMDAVPSCYPTRVQSDTDRRHVYMNIAFKEDGPLRLPEQKKTENKSPQQTLTTDISLEDKVNSILTCIEMHDEGITREGLEGEGFSYEFIDECINRKIIHIKSNGKVGAGA